MRVRIVLVVACLSSSLLFARRASATDCSGVLSTCINDDTLWPHPGRSQFEQVGSTETLANGQLGFGLVTSYLSRPIVLKLRSPGGGSDRFAINDQVNATFLWAYGVTRRLQLDLALPITLGQGGSGLAPVTGGGGINDTAVRDLRFGLAYALVGRDATAPGSGATEVSADGLSVAGRLEVSAPSGDRSQFAGEHAAVFAPSLSADYRVGRLLVGAEVGLRIRPIASLLGSRVGTQVLTAIGASVDILPRDLLAVNAEAWALPTLVAQEDVLVQSNTYVTRTNDKVLAPAEWQLSLRSSPVGSDSLSFQIGGGGALPFSGDSALTTPRFRFVLGIRWAPGAVSAIHPAASTPAEPPGPPAGEPPAANPQPSATPGDSSRGVR